MNNKLIERHFSNELEKKLWLEFSEKLYNKFRRELCEEIEEELKSKLWWKLVWEFEEKLRKEIKRQLDEKNKLIGNNIMATLEEELFIKLGTESWEKLKNKLGKLLWFKLGMGIKNRVKLKLKRKLDEEID
jgi:hypothetical protein